MPVFTYNPLIVTGNNRKKSTRFATTVRERTAAGYVSPKYSAQAKEGRAIQEFYTPGGADFNMQRTMMDFIGYSYSVLPSKTRVPRELVGRYIPYPLRTLPNYFYADSIQNAEGDVPTGKDATGTATYDEMKLSVQYSTRPYQILDSGTGFEYLMQQYCVITTQTTAKWERLPPEGGQFFWAAGIQPGVASNSAATNAQVITFCEGEVEVVWHQIPPAAIPWAAINNCVGKVDGPTNYDNGTSGYLFLSQTYIGPVMQFLPRTFGQDATVSTPRHDSIFLCLAPKITEPYMMVDGNFAVDIHYRFKVYPFGANNAYRWTTGRFERMIRPGASASSVNIPVVGQVQTVPGGPGFPFYKAAPFESLFWGPQT